MLEKGAGANGNGNGLLMNKMLNSNNDLFITNYDDYYEYI
tara:strand:+ start:416 stop:535 length:120 start_codon:yes stop_codon:yes gene_type:complete